VSVLSLKPSTRIITFIGWLPVIYAFAVIGYPFVSLIYYSFFDYDIGGVPIFNGVNNFVTLFTDPVFYKALYITSIYTVAALAAEFALGILIGYLLFRIPYGKTVFAMIMILPLTIPQVITGIIWKILFDPSYGHVNYFLSLIGINGPLWLSRPTYALIAAIITDIWQWTSFVALVAYAGFSSLQRELIQAAFVDGASEWKTLKDVMIPKIAPLLYIIFLLRLVDCLKVFDNVYSMTGGGPGTATTTLSIFNYLNVMTFYHIGYGCTIGLVFLLLIILITNILMKKIGPVLWGEV